MRYGRDTCKPKAVSSLTSSVAGGSHATRLVLRALPRPNGVRLEVEDDRIGPEACAGGSGNRFGLLFMRERARALGARLSVRRNHRGGTTVSLLLPRNRVVSAADGNMQRDQERAEAP